MKRCGIDVAVKEGVLQGGRMGGGREVFDQTSMRHSLSVPSYVKCILMCIQTCVMVQLK